MVRIFFSTYIIAIVYRQQKNTKVFKKITLIWELDIFIFILCHENVKISSYFREKNDHKSVKCLPILKQTVQLYAPCHINTIITHYAKLMSSTMRFPKINFFVIFQLNLPLKMWWNIKMLKVDFLATKLKMMYIPLSIKISKKIRGYSKFPGSICHIESVQLDYKYP